MLGTDDTSSRNSSETQKDSMGLGDKIKCVPTWSCETFRHVDNYLCKGFPGKIMMDALKELNIEDVWDLLNDNDTEDRQFEKERQEPPPNYHLESSQRNVDKWLTAYNLQHYFVSWNIEDLSLLSQLSEGIAVVDNDNKIPTVGKLVNRKQVKHCQKGSKDPVPLEVVGMDIGYGEGAAVGWHKYSLILVNQCTTQSFIYGMDCSSGADVCETLWKFFIDSSSFPHTLHYNFDPQLVGGKAATLLRSHSTRLACCTS